MNRSALFLFAALAGCGDPGPPEFRLSGDTVALRHAYGLSLCELAAPTIQGPTPRYPTPLRCQEASITPPFGTWTFLEDDLFVAEFVDSDATRCVGGCNQLRRVDVATSSVQDLLPEPRPIRRWELGPSRVLWSDAEKDANGGCFFPDGDRDCALDLWTADRASGEASPLTDHGRLPPAGARSGWEAFDVSDAGVVYVLRSLDPTCFVNGAPPPERTDCTSAVRLVDPRSGEEREVVSATQLNVHVRLAEDRLVWLTGSSANALELVVRPLAEGPTKTLAPRVDRGGAAFRVAAPWIVWQADGRLFAHHVERGETQPITAPEDVVFDFEIADGRVVWMDEGWALTLVDLETGARSLLMELP